MIGRVCVKGCSVASLHLHRNDKRFVYIGRQNARLKYAGIEESVLANPFKITVDRNRVRSINLYRNWIREKISIGNKSIIKELQRIKTLEDTYLNVYLACWCERNEPCHADVLIDILHSWKIVQDAKAQATYFTNSIREEK